MMSCATKESAGWLHICVMLWNLAAPLFCVSQHLHSLQHLHNVGSPCSTFCLRVCLFCRTAQNLINIFEGPRSNFFLKLRKMAGTPSPNTNPQFDFFLLRFQDTRGSHLGQEISQADPNLGEGEFSRQPFFPTSSSHSRGLEPQGEPPPHMEGQAEMNFHSPSPKGFSQLSRFFFFSRALLPRAVDHPPPSLAGSTGKQFSRPDEARLDRKFFATTQLDLGGFSASFWMPAGSSPAAGRNPPSPPPPGEGQPALFSQPGPFQLADWALSWECLIFFYVPKEWRMDI